jgi:murein peptide amidase A
MTMACRIDWLQFLGDFGREAEQRGFVAEELGTFDGGPMIAWDRPGAGTRIYLSAGMHGDEPAGPLALMELMRAGFFDAAHAWSICPALNLSGLTAATRENAAGIDLNRDYWHRATPEVAAHAAWLESRPRPDVFVSLHEDWETGGFYFYEINLGADLPERAHAILDAVEPLFPREAGPEIDGHIAREPGWIYHAADPDRPQGWPEAIFLAKLGCPVSFTFETPSHAALEQRIAAHVAGVRAVCGISIR